MENQKNILVTGGCGYIGSHTVRQLVQSGYNPVVIDNLSTGHLQNIVHDIPVYEKDIADQSAVEDILRKHQISTIVHFAGSIIVSESVENPIKYYENNVTKSVQLLSTALKCKVKSFVFSSYSTPT